MTESDGKKKAIHVIIMFGFISLFSDITYQAGRSLSGPFLGELGANALLVGNIAGFAEFIGYALRLAVGNLVDRSRAYWFFTIAGYALLATVPLMALAGGWQIAALFIICERLSKAIRGPAKDTILSMAARRVGTGYGFGLHKIMDQAGAVIGPLCMSLILSGVFGGLFKKSELSFYHTAYAFLAIPFIVMLLLVIFGRSQLPHPERLEEELNSEESQPLQPTTTSGGTEKLTLNFWIYTIFTLLSGMGFVNFTLLSFHAKVSGIMSDNAIPFWYALAMAAGGAAAFISGRLYDKKGFAVLVAVPVLSLPLPFLGFLNHSLPLMVAAILLYGVSLGIQETVIKAGIADLTSLKKRGTGYGIFNLFNGIGLYLSSSIMGRLYNVSSLAICLFTVFAELAGFIVLFFLIHKKHAVSSNEK